jgi:hypothetical protein
MGDDVLTTFPVESASAMIPREIRERTPGELRARESVRNGPALRAGIRGALELEIALLGARDLDDGCARLLEERLELGSQLEQAETQVALEAELPNVGAGGFVRLSLPRFRRHTSANSAERTSHVCSAAQPTHRCRRRPG